MNADAHLNLDALSEAALKDAMGSFATGITVVTTHFEGADYGMTCNSFNTVSLEPPMVLWSIRRASGAHTAFTRSGGYAISVLSDRQTGLATRFTKGTSAERFGDVPVERLSSGRLAIEEAVAWFDCAVENVIEAGDHDVLIGRVLDFASDGNRTPLGYVRGRFIPMEG